MQLKNKALRIFCVPVGLFLTMLPFSFLTGWSIATMAIYWFLLIPFIIEYLPTLFFKNKNQLTQSLIGMLLFYLFMVFMIYDHYKTDMFQMMVVSCGINLVTVTVISRVRKMHREPAT
jgi:hypothetical protein